MDFNKKLLDLKKSNKERKLKLAIANGFSTVESYLEFLVNEIKKEVLEPVTQPTEIKPTKIQKCVLLDRSGSMRGSKLNNAINGINEEIESLKNEDVDYIYTLIIFDSTIEVIVNQQPIKTVSKISFMDRGYTALYDALGKAFELFAESTDKVLINIFTDGEENASRKYTRNQIKDLINKYDHITTTFVGTEFDVHQVQRDLGIEKTNTLSYDGTGQGLKMSMESTITATKSFAADVSRGVDVKKGFYKKINN